MDASGLGFCSASAPLRVRPLRSLGKPKLLKGPAAVSTASKWAERLLGDFHILTSNTSDASNCSSGSLPSSHPHVPPSLSLSEERYVTIPLQFYEVLGAEIHFLGDGIKRAYDAKVSKPPQYGFSQEALISRRQILQAACETLANSQSRRDYNQGLLQDEVETMMTQVPWDKVPGALCVLLESGKAGDVLSIGEGLLKERLPKWFKQDVVLVMTLAFVDLSRDAMALSPPSFLNACEFLERALKLLQEEGASSLAPDLRAQIDDTLEEIAPRCVLERLALPLDEENRTRREEGLIGMRNILWAVGGGGAAPVAGGFTREDFMNESFLLMSTAEQVDLFNTTPENIPPEDFEAYSVALAIVAQAFVGKKPSLIPNADNLFQQLQSQYAVMQSSPTSFYYEKRSHEMDFALERGLCSLLIGKVDECRMWLGLDSETSPYRDPSIVDFIVENSRGNDLNDLHGLCKLLETWLSEVVFPKFRDTRGISFKLGDYYDDPTVLRYLERMEGDGASPLSAAAAIVKIGTEEATAVLGHVKASALHALQKVFPPRNGMNPTEGGENTEEMRESDAAVDKKDLEMPDEERNFIKRKNYSVAILSAGVAAVSVALLGFKLIYPREQQAVSSIVASDLSDVGDEEGLAGMPKMNASVAESVVRRWQSAKSEAFGAERRIEELGQVLDGHMLSAWKQRASEVMQRGWVYHYTLLDVSIESVTVSVCGRRAVVEATLKESTALMDAADPEKNASNVGSYTARYEMAYSHSAWKIVEGALIM